MNIRANGTTIRSTPAGIVATRGARELHLIGTSVNQIDKARQLLADHSFDKLFKAAMSTPLRNTRKITLTR